MLSITRFRWAITLLIGVLAIVSRLALLPVVPVPYPGAHDEFAYILQAETFLEGRLTNAPPELPEFFEAPNEIVRPVRMSKYPPGQASFLALGLLAGTAYYGVVLSYGLFCATMFWMLTAVLPVRWAAAVALMVLLAFHVQHYWLETYWGGFVAATGGNLVIGSLFHFWRNPQGRAKWWVVPGLLLLSISRPFEGLIFCGALFLAVLWIGWPGASRSIRDYWRSWRLPLVAALAATLMVHGTYNQLSLKSPLSMPYMEHERHYTMAPVVWLFPPRDLHYSDPIQTRFHVEWELKLYKRVMNRLPFAMFPVQLARVARAMIWQHWGLLSFVLLAIPFLWRLQKVRFLAGLLLIGALVLSLEVWLFAHYMAPFIGASVALLGIALRGISARIMQLKLAPWRPVFATVVTAACLIAGHGIVTTALGPKPPTPPRVLIGKSLEHQGGKHLVFVRYSLQREPSGPEWVFNGPDLDRQQVLWARDRGQENVRLMQQYADRTPWLVEADVPHPQAIPYSEAKTLDPAFQSLLRKESEGEANSLSRD
ncbi:MAG TPA: hypothetical protein VE621_15075 [Bryobacteraceae bacterium]|nr:hypothetical protein [Bryobacteraceae bacterium]